MYRALDYVSHQSRTEIERLSKRHMRAMLNFCDVILRNEGSVLRSEGKNNPKCLKCISDNLFVSSEHNKKLGIKELKDMKFRLERFQVSDAPWLKIIDLHYETQKFLNSEPSARFSVQRANDIHYFN